MSSLQEQDSDLQKLIIMKDKELKEKTAEYELQIKEFNEKRDHYLEEYHNKSKAFKQLTAVCVEGQTLNFNEDNQYSELQKKEDFDLTEEVEPIEEQLKDKQNMV